MTSGIFRVAGMLCVPLVVVWLMLLGNTARRTRRTVYRGMAVACARLGLLVSLLALIFLRRCQALMPCIMAVMDQINS